MDKKTKKGYKDPAKKSKFIPPELLKIFGDVEADRRAKTYKEKIRNLLKNIKGIPSDADVARIKRSMPEYNSGGPVKVMGGIGKRIEDKIKTIDIDTAPKKIFKGLAGRLAKRGYGKAKKP